MHSSRAKGISQAEAMSSSKKNLSLAIVELRESEGISQSVARSVGQGVSQYKIPLNKFFS